MHRLQTAEASYCSFTQQFHTNQYHFLAYLDLIKVVVVYVPINAHLIIFSLLGIWQELKSFECDAG